MRPRSAALEVTRHNGFKAWKQQIGYRRSLAERAMGRVKAISGDCLQARSWKSQVSECYLRIAIMNRMTKLGMPLSKAIYR